MPFFKKQILDYFKKHPMYNSIIHALGGLGVGIIISRPFVDHPVQFGGLLIFFSLIGHLYPIWIKK